MNDCSPLPVAHFPKHESATGKVEPFYCYRERTLALLRRYFRLSMQIGRLPALLGREVFRARVTSYRMTTFEDAVIFVHDVERCLDRLPGHAQQVIARIVFEEYTFTEAARSLNIRVSSVYERYERAVDELSRIFLQLRILRPLGERPRRAVRAAEKRPAARLELQAASCQVRIPDYHAAVSCCA